MNDNHCPTPTRLPPTPDLPQPSTADTNPQEDRYTHAGDPNVPTLALGDEIYDKIETWEKIVKVDVSEVKGTPEQVRCRMADPGYLLELRDEKEGEGYTGLRKWTSVQ